MVRSLVRFILVPILTDLPAFLFWAVSIPKGLSGGSRPSNAYAGKRVQFRVLHGMLVRRLAPYANVPVFTREHDHRSIFSLVSVMSIDRRHRRLMGKYVEKKKDPRNSLQLL